MFNLERFLARTFTPVDGGYLYFPSAKSGGKLVSAAEYDVLTEQWRRVLGGSAMLVAFLLIVASSVVLIVAAVAFRLPPWTVKVSPLLFLPALFTWMWRPAFAAGRLVRGRPDIAPPRPLAELRRAGRAALDWKFVAGFMVYAGWNFSRSARLAERTWWDWMWLALWGAVLVLNLGIAWFKWRDQQGAGDSGLA